MKPHRHPVILRRGVGEDALRVAGEKAVVTLDKLAPGFALPYFVGGGSGGTGKEAGVEGREKVAEVVCLGSRKGYFRAGKHAVHEEGGPAAEKEFRVRGEIEEPVIARAGGTGPGFQVYRSGRLG